MQPSFLPSLVSFKPYTLGLPLCFTCISFSCPYSPPPPYLLHQESGTFCFLLSYKATRQSIVCNEKIVCFELYVSTSLQTRKQAKPHELSCKVTFGNNCWNWWRGYSWKIFTHINIKNWTAYFSQKKVYSILAKNCQLCQPRITNFVISYSPTCFISTASVNSLPKVKCVWNRNSASFNFNVKKLSMWIISEDCRSLQQSMTVF